jgi:glutathione S-transferase
MTKPEIIGSIASTYTRVVCMVCEEKGIEYVLTERPLRAPELRAIHPFGKMPVLRHGDFVLFESKAIANYLDRSFPAPYVFPSEPCLAALTGLKDNTPRSDTALPCPAAWQAIRPTKVSS